MVKVSLIYSSIILCFATFGIFSNFLLIYLILRYTMKEMKVYSKILLQTCIIDIITITSFAISQPNFASDNGVGTMWNYGPIHLLPNPWQHIILRFYFFMARLTAMNVSTLFIYRYLTVVCDVDVKFKHQLILIFSIMIPILILDILAFISNNPTPENEHLTNYELAKIFDLDNDTIKNYVVGLRSRSNNLSIFVSNYATILTIINYLIIIFCGIKIQIYVYRHYKGIEMIKVRNMNKQISIVLIAQAILPLLTFINHLTANLNFLFNIPGLYSSYIGIFLGSSLNSLVAILNSIVTIVTVRNYRQVIFRCRRAQIHQVVPIPETSMPDRPINLNQY
ncbi:hypothetical protein Mgra_00001606 [Meloidogyne graminicola]|uniref:Uncharacterized protein n=1 Tax=Meloidogyne graminicola TaxID=189291 RepID=A0A8S9ZZF7_9BILA|nr:hypothetical protein Mgra_00001606 [Meloidogyne graminicola]